MTRVLKTSGFLGLAVMMGAGLYQFSILAGGSQVPGWLVGGHAHLGVLSILAVVVGFAVDAFALSGTLRTAVTGLFLAGQWGLPLTIWIAEGGGVMVLLPTAWLWGLALIVAMLLMAWQAATGEVDVGEPPAAAPADD